MSNKKPTDAVHAGISLTGNKEDVRNHYDNWADTYDVELREAEYVGPKETVDVLVEYLDSQNTLNLDLNIVDGGCGTGLVGLYLQQAGFKNIDGFDLSELMIEKARETQIYNRLEGMVGFSEASDSFGKDIYDVAVTCGVFTHGHVQPEAVFDFAKIVKPNGLLLVVTRPSYCEDSNFEEVSLSGSLNLLKCFKDRPYTSDENAHYWVFRKKNS